ncbi:MAG: acylphosphatase [Patescibacteria group bacterium]
MQEIDIIITGKVQGVFYRQNAKQQAEWLKLAGYAENLSNGAVHIHIKGEDEAVSQFVDWCRSGPVHALVEDVKVLSAQEKIDSDEFVIK